MLNPPRPTPRFPVCKNHFKAYSLPSRYIRCPRVSRTRRFNDEDSFGTAVQGRVSGVGVSGEAGMPCGMPIHQHLLVIIIPRNIQSCNCRPPQPPDSKPAPHPPAPPPSATSKRAHHPLVHLSSSHTSGGVRTPASLGPGPRRRASSIVLDSTGGEMAFVSRGAVVVKVRHRARGWRCLRAPLPRVHRRVGCVCCVRVGKGGRGGTGGEEGGGGWLPWPTHSAYIHGLSTACRLRHRRHWGPTSGGFPSTTKT